MMYYPISLEKKNLLAVLSIHKFVLFFVAAIFHFSDYQFYNL